MKKPNSKKSARSERRREAIDRQKLRENLSDTQQLEKLDNVFGKVKGATKERARLLFAIKEEKLKRKRKRKKSKKI